MRLLTHDRIEMVKCHNCQEPTWTALCANCGDPHRIATWGWCSACENERPLADGHCQECEEERIWCSACDGPCRSCDGEGGGRHVFYDRYGCPSGAGQPDDLNDLDEDLFEAIAQILAAFQGNMADLRAALRTREVFFRFSGSLLGPAALKAYRLPGGWGTHIASLDDTTVRTAVPEYDLRTDALSWLVSLWPGGEYLAPTVDGYLMLNEYLDAQEATRGRHDDPR